MATNLQQSDALVSTGWVAERLNDPTVRIVEVDVDPKLYAAGHIPGAVGWDWNTDLQDRTRRDVLSKEAFEDLMSRAGVAPETTLVIYGDSSNWFAAYGFWVAKLYGHRDVRLMDGGRAKWLNEDDKKMTPEVPTYRRTDYRAAAEDPALRARVPEVLEAAGARRVNLVDVRSADEFTGKVIAPPGMTETAQRGGHIPGAKSVPWGTAVQADGTFKPVEELRRIYVQEKGVDPAKPTIAYCRIGERSSHTWFVLKYLLGLPEVKNYDGSWTEYGNLVGVPIEKP